MQGFRPRTSETYQIRGMIFWDLMLYHPFLGGLVFSRTYENAVYNPPYLNAFPIIHLNPPQDVLC